MTPEARLRQRDKEMIPTVLIRAMGILVVCSLLIVSYAVLTARPLEAVPPTPDTAAIAHERVIRIHGNMDGSARVLDEAGQLIAAYAPDEGGFIAGIGRVLERERGAVGLAGSEPIRLIRYENGHLALFDDLTDFRVDLTGFGADNLAVFAALMEG